MAKEVFPNLFIEEVQADHQICGGSKRMSLRENCAGSDVDGSDNNEDTHGLMNVLSKMQLFGKPNNGNTDDPPEDLGPFPYSKTLFKKASYLVVNSPDDVIQWAAILRENTNMANVQDETNMNI